MSTRLLRDRLARMLYFEAEVTRAQDRGRHGSMEAVARTSMLSFMYECCREVDVVVDKQAFWALRHKEELDAVPSRPGVYVLYGNHWFDYPRGKSPVFYIGQSTNLRARLATHWSWAAQAAKANRDLHLYWPRYEYAARYGEWFAYARTRRGLTPRGLEEMAMSRFADKHRAFPVANGAGSWNRVGVFEGYAYDD